MGYNTKFEVNPENLRWEINDHLGWNAINDSVDGVKWYDWNKDMKSFSLSHPDMVIELTGVGEEHPDIWKAYFKNGKSYKEMAKIVYSAFDEGKMS